MPVRTGIIKATTVKNYVTKKKKMHSQTAVIKKLVNDFSNTIKAVIVEAVVLAKAAKRNTVMKDDVIAAINKHLKKKDLSSGHHFTKDIFVFSLSLFFTLLFSYNLYSEINEKKEAMRDIKPFYEFIQKNGVPPVEFTLSALSKYRVVILGEIHHVKQIFDYYFQIVKSPRFPELAGFIFLEFKSTTQENIDKFFNNETLDYKLLPK